MIETQQVAYVRLDRAAVGQVLPQHRSLGTPAGWVMAISPEGQAVMLGFDDTDAMRQLAGVLNNVADVVDQAEAEKR